MGVQLYYLDAGPCGANAYEYTLTDLEPGATYACAVASESEAGISPTSLRAYPTAGFGPLAPMEGGRVGTPELYTLYDNRCPRMALDGRQPPPGGLQAYLAPVADGVVLEWYYCLAWASLFRIECRPRGGEGDVLFAQDLSPLCWTKEMTFQAQLPGDLLSSALEFVECAVRAVGEWGESEEAVAGVRVARDGTLDSVSYCDYQEASLGQLASGGSSGEVQAANIVQGSNGVLGSAGGGGGCAGDEPPPGNPRYTCQQQSSWGKCGEPFMTGYCLLWCSGQCDA
mmetsp:Transcript_27372/g.76454  ORF Transcript_27372/g.76454 Transcript_27372/m.76454 type:complete len:284 (+) Transcript_27372:1-852(+)